MINLVVNKKDEGATVFFLISTWLRVVFSHYGGMRKFERLPRVFLLRQNEA